MMSDAFIATGYADAALEAWAERARRWAAGIAPADGCAPRDVFIYFINGAKERARAAAMTLLARLVTS